MPYTHLTENENVISRLKVAGFILREIARRLNRHHPTVSRERKRNVTQCLRIPFTGMTELSS
jgi:IS30 family transposase